MTKKSDEIYLIDGSTYIYRAYHTTGGLTNSDGFPTGAVFGFTNMLMRTLREKRSQAHRRRVRFPRSHASP